MAGTISIFRNYDVGYDFYTRDDSSVYISEHQTIIVKEVGKKGLLKDVITGSFYDIQ